MKGLSLITDFGCKSNCKYCIWKSNENNKRVQNIDAQLDTLKNILYKGRYQKFSISGGGDPLNNFYLNYQFWKRINWMSFLYNVKYDIHTSYENYFYHRIWFGDALNKFVFHATPKRNPINIFKKTIENQIKLRICYVITDDINIEFLSKMEEFVNKNKEFLQLGYREYVGDVYKPRKEVDDFCKSVEERVPTGKYIYQNDYNTYIMPDGTITEKFL